ncbi:Uncharacterised protein [uncultured archaeon]|nr:Uncharacterised protein [uncultured archaeon]
MEVAAEKFKQNKNAAEFIGALENEIQSMKRSGRADNILTVIKTAAKTAKELNQTQTAADMLACALTLYEQGKNHAKEKVKLRVEMNSLYSEALGSGQNGAGKELVEKIEKNGTMLGAEYTELVNSLAKIKNIEERIRKMYEAAELIEKYNSDWAYRTLESARGQLMYSKVPASEGNIKQIRNYWYPRLNNKVQEIKERNFWNERKEIRLETAGIN